MIGDEFRIHFSDIKAEKPWYYRLRTYAIAALVIFSFYAGNYYNAYRQIDAVVDHGDPFPGYYGE